MAKSAFELLNERFGVRTRVEENPELTEFGVADEIFLRADPNRLAFVLINLSANVIHVKPGDGVSSSAGIALVPNQGSLAVSFEDDFTLPTLEWHGIAAGAASAVFLLQTLVAPD